jgi:hypothetical protein
VPGRLAVALLCLCGALAVAGCGGDDDSATTQAEERLEQAGSGPADVAAPEAPLTEEGEEEPLAADDEVAVRAAVTAYVDGLNRHDGAAVCALAAPGAIPLDELPAARAGCAASLDASIGTRPQQGGPAWKRTRIIELTTVSVGPERARVTATVMHRFSDRGYRSVEEDVIYLERSGDRWLLAKPSGTLYRAVGYPEPPLRALTPPPS